MTHNISPGLAILQSNRTEDLRRILLGHLSRFPLRPLENEVILVQSAGIGRWLQLGMAMDSGRERLEGGLGIAASARFQQPARFLWDSYRSVLGDEAVPESSPLDSAPLRWRLYGLLPGIVDDPAFRPLRLYLDGGTEPSWRLWQLAGQLASLFEQYQIYRADWLADWEGGHNRLKDGLQRPTDLDPRQAWQPALWRQLLESMPAGQKDLSRAHLHRKFLAHLEHGLPKGSFESELPRRVALFGISSLPGQLIDGLAALAKYIQVVVCLQNPCQHYWSDIIEGRDLLRTRPGKRSHYRPNWPSQLDDQTIHEHANPLLAAWGRQGRDFLALLDERDQPEHYAHWFQRIDLFQNFTTGTENGLLQQIQQGILDLHPRVKDGQSRPSVNPRLDKSLRFHVAHSPQREVEILHDQILAALEEDESLQPRDIIVMVPDIDTYAPHIEAVFGARAGEQSNDTRHIPYSIADRRERLSSPALRAFTVLLDLPRLRLTANEVIDLLNVPAVRQRFGIAPEQIEQIVSWLSHSGIRWGLNGQHRASLGLEHPFEQFSWTFGIGRMLLGHASGEADAFDGILPFDEVAGGDADLAGRLAQLVDRLIHHWQALQGEREIAEWARLLRALVHDFFDWDIDADDMTGYQLDQLIDELVDTAETADLGQVLPLEVVRDALIEQLDHGLISRRFLAGRVNFATLMPMRAIPFSMVCLLGMNDGEFPRTRKPADFDLMGLAGMQRPGDRSRREDDRYLFLEALLAARQYLYISWVGRSVHNDEKQPPCVLVGQLRDHVANGWKALQPETTETDPGTLLLAALTTWHPLQPFSRRYFEGDQQLFTFAAEWRQAHCAAKSPPVARSLEPWPVDGPLTVQPLAEFLSQPVKYFTSQRLRAHPDQISDSLADCEPFGLDGLEKWAVEDELIRELIESEQRSEWPQRLLSAGQRLALAGRLPLGEAAERTLREANDKALTVAELWCSAVGEWPEQFVPGIARLDIAGVDGEPLVVEQWLPKVRRNARGVCALIQATATRLTARPGARPPPRWEKLVRFWPMHLLINAAGFETHTILVHQRGCIEWHPVSPDTARSELGNLVRNWQTGLRRPLPVATATSVAYLTAIRTGKAETARSTARRKFEDQFNTVGEVSREPAVARWYPDFNSLSRAGNPGDDFAHWSEALYGPVLDQWAVAKGSDDD